MFASPDRGLIDCWCGVVGGSWPMQDSRPDRTTTNKTGPRNASASRITLKRAIGYRLLESRPGGCSADNVFAEPHEVKSTCKRWGLHCG